eukprot:jgi/Ulvmu1/195/UM001_0199.1
MLLARQGSPVPVSKLTVSNNSPEGAVEHRVADAAYVVLAWAEPPVTVPWSVSLAWGMLFSVIRVARAGAEGTHIRRYRTAGMWQCHQWLCCIADRLCEASFLQ